MSRVEVACDRNNGTLPDQDAVSVHWDDDDLVGGKGIINPPQNLYASFNSRFRHAVHETMF